MFIQRDPIGLLGGVNVFAYAPNPIHWIDVLGLVKNKPVRRQQTTGDIDVSTARAARREAMRRNNIPTSQSYQATLIKDGKDANGNQMYIEKLSIGGRKSEGSKVIGNIKVHPKGHLFDDDKTKPITYEKPHYHGPKGEHISYDKGTPRSSNRYKGQDIDLC